MAWILGEIVIGTKLTLTSALHGLLLAALACDTSHRVGMAQRASISIHDDVITPVHLDIGVRTMY